MDWIKVTIYTSAEGIEGVTGRLYQLGITGLEIEDEQEGYYVMITFTSKPEFPAELDRIYNITDGVLRSLTVAVEE